jgi:HAD superfamily hydrolase (TIGR01662 family)
MQSSKLFTDLPIRLGLGLLRLCGEGRPSESDAIALIHRALDRGIRLLDTADVYCIDDKDLHYGETLAKKALDSWSGDRSLVKILTKVGLTRPKGKWAPNGSRKHLLKAVDGSLKALGVEQLYLCQLHVKDPRVPYQETLATLAELQKSGKILHLGLCNVGPPEIRQAARHFQIASIQNELSVQTRKSSDDGTLELAKIMGIPFLAYRPMGGHAKVDKLTKNRVLSPLTARLQSPPLQTGGTWYAGITAQELALAAVLEAGEHVISLIGPSRPETLDSCLRAASLKLDGPDMGDALAAVQVKYDFAPDPIALESLTPRVMPEGMAKLEPNQGPGSEPEVVIVMGVQGAGKSELVYSYHLAGYARLNRDEEGGTLDQLIPRLEALLQQGQKRVVLDNTYPSRISRAAVVSVAHRYGVPVRCRHVKIGLRDAQINVVSRVLERHGKLLGPVEMKELAKVDNNLPPPAALQRWMDSYEPPESDEGFSAIDEIEFVRRPSEGTQKGLLLDVDGTLRTTISGEIYPRTPEDVHLLPGRREVLQRWIEAGYQLFFVSNQSGISNNHLTEEAAQACFDRTVELLDLPVKEIVFCPHPAFPVGCFCRKPMPGLGVYLQREHQLALEEMVMVGDMDSDAAFAAGLGIRYFDAEEFFRQ